PSIDPAPSAPRVFARVWPAAERSRVCSRLVWAPEPKPAPRSDQLRATEPDNPSGAKTSFIPPQSIPATQPYPRRPPPANSIRLIKNVPLPRHFIDRLGRHFPQPPPDP